MKCAPIEAVILALDPAKHTSGAVILIPDYGDGLAATGEAHSFNGSYALHEFGKVETQEERGRFIESFLEVAEDMGLPLVVMAETWDPPRTRKVRLPGGFFGFLMDPKWTYTTVLGIGEGWGRWTAELETAQLFLEEEGLPAFTIERVTPNDWRDALWGANRARDTEALKETACRTFEGVFGYAASADISEAGCIALYATTCPAVEAAAAQWNRKLTELEQKVAKDKSKAKTKRKKRKVH